MLLGGLQLGDGGIDGSEERQIGYGWLVRGQVGEVVDLVVERLETLRGCELLLVGLVELLKPLGGGGLGLLVCAKDLIRLAGKTGELVGEVYQRQRSVALNLLDRALL